MTDNKIESKIHIVDTNYFEWLKFLRKEYDLEYKRSGTNFDSDEFAKFINQRYGMLTKFSGTFEVTNEQKYLVFLLKWR